jgi:hypothetical protein
MWLLNCPGRRMINIRLKECDFVTVPVTGVVMDGFPKRRKEDAEYRDTHGGKREPVF